MNRIVQAVATTALLGSLSLAPAAFARHQTPARPAAHNVATAKFAVKGMGCSKCVEAVHNALARVKGVTKVSVSLMTNSAQVAYNPKETSIRSLEKAVPSKFKLTQKPAASPR